MASASVRAGRRLPRAFYRRDPREVAPDLLNKVLVAADGRAGASSRPRPIAAPLDAAAHTYRGQTARNAVMFGAPGLLYVYFTYGMHWCCNAVCGEEGEGVAVLLRAAEPLAGLATDARGAAQGEARSRPLQRPRAPVPGASASPARRTASTSSPAYGGFGIVDDGIAAARIPWSPPRIGIRHAAEEPWRWYVRGNPNVSRP